MRPERRAQQIVGRPNVGHPIPHSLADRILQRLRARRNPAHLRAQEAHALYVQILPLHVHVAHVDHALQSQQCAHRRRGHAVLPRAGFCNHALLAHALRQQPLSERVVDLVRACVQQVFALQINLCPAQRFRQPLGKVERRGPPGVILEQGTQLRLKRRVGLGLVVRVLQLIQRRHQRLRHVPPAVDAKAPRSRLARICRNNDRRHEALLPDCQQNRGTLQCTRGTIEHFLRVRWGRKAYPEKSSPSPVTSALVQSLRRQF